MSVKHNFCRECGTSLSDGAAFCGECGASVHKDPDKHSGRKTQNEKKKRKVPSNNAGIENGFKIVPLLIWAGAWSVGWILVPAIYALVISGFFYLGYWSERVLFWLTVGLIAAALLQWFNITSRRPTAKMALLVVCSWFVLNCVMQWMHQTYNAIPMFFAGSFVGACLAWMITRQVAKTDQESYSKMSIIPLMAGWALCGAFGGIGYGYFPYKFLIVTVLFITVIAAIFLKREKYEGLASFKPSSGNKNHDRENRC